MITMIIEVIGASIPLLYLYVLLLNARNEMLYYKRLWEMERDTPRDTRECRHQEVLDSYIRLSKEGLMALDKMTRERNEYRDAWRNHKKTLPEELTALLNPLKKP